MTKVSFIKNHITTKNRGIISKTGTSSFHQHKDYKTSFLNDFFNGWKEGYVDLTNLLEGHNVTFVDMTQKGPH